MARKFINVSEVIRNGKKTYRARLTFPFDDNLGYRPAPKDFYGATAAEADRKRREYKPENKSVDNSISFVNYVRDVFLPEQQQIAEVGKDMSWSYFLRRRANLNRYLINPEDKRLVNLDIRKVRLGSLRPAQVEEFFNKLKVVDISDEYRRRLKDDFRAILRLAKHKLPCTVAEYLEDVDVPALSILPANPRQIFDADEIENIIFDTSKPIADRVYVAFLYILNCRPQEMYALKWSDINFKRNTVDIYQKVVKIKGGYRTEKGSKTGEDGVRYSLPLGPLGEMLAEHKKQRDSEMPEMLCAECGHPEGRIWHGEPRIKLSKRNARKHPFKLGAARAKSEYVFTSVEGVQLNSSNAKRKWAQVKQSLGLPNGPKFYSLKHLGNSVALERGVTLEAQAAKMGHASTEMAARVYRQISDKERVKSVSIYGNGRKDA